LFEKYSRYHHSGHTKALEFNGNYPLLSGMRLTVVCAIIVIYRPLLCIKNTRFNKRGFNFMPGNKLSIKKSEKELKNWLKV
jgi:hypothetical protein